MKKKRGGKTGKKKRKKWGKPRKRALGMIGTSPEIPIGNSTKIPLKIEGKSADFGAFDEKREVWGFSPEKVNLTRKKGGIWGFSPEEKRGFNVEKGEFEDLAQKN